MTRAIAEGIFAEVERATGITAEKIRERNRKRKVVMARQSIMYALRKRTKWSTPQIARFVGLTDHSTVIHGIARIERDRHTNADIAALVMRLMESEPVAPFSIRRESRPKPKLFKPKSPIIALVMVEKPPKPVLERVAYESDRFMQLDERGECDVQRYARKNMLSGSQKLAAAIIAARATA